MATIIDLVPPSSGFRVTFHF